jgi:hypothetical protein
VVEKTHFRCNTLVPVLWQRQVHKVKGERLPARNCLVWPASEESTNTFTPECAKHLIGFMASCCNFGGCIVAEILELIALWHGLF